MKKTKLSILVSGLLSLSVSSPLFAYDIINNETKVVDYLWENLGPYGTNELLVGKVSNGSLIVTAGGDIQIRLLHIGRDGANGQVDIINGGRIQINTSGYVSPLVIGGGDSSNISFGNIGVLNIIGVGSELISNVDSPALVGRNGVEGRLTISEGGKMQLTADDTGWGAGLWIGHSGSTSTQGTVVVDGAGSEIYSKSRIVVGLYNQGTATVRNGGTLITDSALNVGNESSTLTTDSLLLVTGLGSSVTTVLSTTIGNLGTGNVVIADSATLTTPNIYIASKANSRGELAIGARTGQTAEAAGVINTETIKFGLGTGSLVFNHTSDDYRLAADISGKGAINALSGTTQLSGDNTAYQGLITIAEPATIEVSEQKNLGTNQIVNNGALSIVTDHDWNFVNTMSGAGLLNINTDGHQFSFDSMALIENFTGSMVFENSAFNLSSLNAAVLSHIGVALASDSLTTVGVGQQTLSDLSFDGGTLAFGLVTPGQTTADNQLHTTGVLDISGSGTIQVDVSGAISNDRPIADTKKSLLEQDNENTLMQLITSAGTVIGSGGSLTLVDQEGVAISDSTTAAVMQNSQIVANNTYDYRLSAGDNNDGLYISYGLTAIELLGHQADALILDTLNKAGNSAELSAKITGNGDLAIDTGLGQSVTLSNLDNDYQGVTDIRSGNLIMQNSHVMGNTSLLQLAENTSLNMAGHSQTVGELTTDEGSQVNINGGVLTISDGGQVKGQLIGSGSLTIAGGVLDIDGANQSLSAATHIADSAKAIVNDMAGLGSGHITVAGELAINHSTGSLVNAMSNSGSVTLTESHVTLAGNNSLFTGAFTLDADSQLITTDDNLGTATVNNEGELVVNNSSHWLLTNTIQGNGAVTKQGSGIASLTHHATYSGATDIQQGGLILGSASNAMTLASQQTTIHDEAFLAGFGGVAGSIDNAGRLYIGAYDGVAETLQTFTIGQNLTNSGTLYVGQHRVQRASMGNTVAGNQLQVLGNYRGDNGLIHFNTVLNGDKATTDSMVIDGDTDGTTYVSVDNAGGTGAQTMNGIRLIQVNGQSGGEFIQAGRIVAGAYDYSLVRGNGALASNWYLASHRNSPEPSLRPDGGAYVANLAEANTLFVSRLHDRAGETQYTHSVTGQQDTSSLWLRQSGGLAQWSSGNGQLTSKSYRYVMQLGGDIAQWSSHASDRWHVGAMLGYANSHSNTRSNMTGYSARANVNGYSGGLYGTWYQDDQNKTGLYVDSWLQYSRFNNQVHGEQLVQESYQSRGVTSSIESGYTYQVDQIINEDGTTINWYLRPQAQAVWMGVKADDHREANGTEVSSPNKGNVMTRLGVRSSITAQSANDKSSYHQIEPFVELNWIHNSQDFAATLNNETINQEGARHLGEIKLGVSGQINQPLNLWANVATQFGEKDYRDTSATLGVNYRF